MGGFLQLGETGLGPSGACLSVSSALVGYPETTAPIPDV